MENNKFISLFRHLEKEEVTAFGKYLRTSKSRNKIALSVFGKAQKAHPKMSSPKLLNWDKVALKVFPSPEEDLLKAKKKLSNTFHDLYLWLKEFLYARKANEKSLESELMWLAILKEKGMEEQFKKELQKLCAAVLEKEKTAVTDYFHGMVAGYYAYENSGKVTGENLSAVSYSLEIFYQLYRQKLDCEILNWKRQGRAGDLRTTHDNANLPLRKLYRSLHQLISNGTDENYQALFSELQKQAEEISENERAHVLQYLKNHCAQKVRNGEIGYLDAAHELDKFVIMHNMAADKKGQITPRQFLNIVSVAGAVNENHWAEKFVGDYISYLKEDVRNECRVIALALLQVKARQFEKALQNLEQLVNYQGEDISISINHRLCELMALFETDAEDDVMFKKITNFSRYLERQSKPRWGPIVATKNFLSIFYQLVLAKKPKERILDQIRAANLLYMREWLLEKTIAYKPMR